MTRNRILIGELAALYGMFPALASAQTASISEVIGLFNIVAGCMFVAAFTLFVGGIISYVVDFGNNERVQGIKLMEWGIAVLFVLVVLLGASEYFQSHPGVTNLIAAAIVIVGFFVLIVMFLSEPSKPAEKKEAPKP